MTTVPLARADHQRELAREPAAGQDECRELRLLRLAHEAALASTDRVVAPSLREFLR